MSEYIISLKENEYQLLQGLLSLIRKYGQKSMLHTLERIGKEQERQLSKEQDEEKDPWSNPDIEIATGDSGIGDLAINHDHYLYGTSKKFSL
jgi:hypothetical protein